MRLVLNSDPEEFSQRAGSFLDARVERNVLATVAADVLAGQYQSVGPVFAYGSDGGEVRFAALRVPPRPMLATELESASARELMSRWLRMDPGLPGVNGTPKSARMIAAAWCELTGRTSRLHMRLALHELQQVCEPPRPAPGRLRLAVADERELLTTWVQAFAREADVTGGDQAAAMVDARLERGGFFVWDHDGPVSMVGMIPAVAGVARIAPVYTPPDRRRRGYAGSAVAAVSRWALAHGASRCVLYTDLANPTSNKIYAEVGFRPIADWEEHAFATA